MRQTFTEIDGDDVVGEPVAEARIDPDVLAERIGFAWTAAEDDLGPLRHAGIRLDSGTSALLIARDRGDDSTVTVVMPREMSHDRSSVLDALGLEPRELLPPLAFSAVPRTDVNRLREQLARQEASITALTASVDALQRAAHLHAQGFQTDFRLRAVPDAGGESDDPANVTGISTLARPRRAAG